MSTRGNSLMVTMISIAILMVLVVGAIRFTGTNRESAVNKLKADRMSSCAESARRFLITRLQASRVNTSKLAQLGPGTPYARLPDDPVIGKRTIIAAAHYGEDPLLVGTGAQIAKGPAAGDRAVQDDANVIREINFGGAFFRVVIKCQEPGASGSERESEIEFIFRHEGI